LTSDREALFAAVLAAPDDDLPRLVFADWLDETGHPANAARAAYIRLQVEADRHPPGSSDRLEMTRQAEELRPSFKDEWDQAFESAELLDTVVGRRRGFVDTVGASPGRLTAVGGRMFAAAPVRALRVVEPYGMAGFADRWTAFTGLPFLTRVRDLQIGPHLYTLSRGRRLSLPTDRNPGPDPLAGLLACPYLTGLRRLALSGNGIEDAGVVAFVSNFPAATFAGTLAELDLSDNQVTDAGAHTLAAGRGFDRLERLVLTGNRITPAGVARLRVRFGDRVLV
jgi:uncharacterized protein (TIGR02996 family)